MARIPLAEIPNAPQVGKPALADPRFPTDEVGGMAQRQIAQGYQSNMVDMKAATAPGEAMQNLGKGMINAGNNAMDTVGYAFAAEKKFTQNQFIQNVQGIREDIAMQAAQSDPSMYPVIVKKAYEDTGRLYQGISGIGQKIIAQDAVRVREKDMADYGLKTYIANQERIKGDSILAMNTAIQNGQWDDAQTLITNLRDTKQLSPAEFVSYQSTLNGAKDTKNLYMAINQNPVESSKAITDSILKGTPLKGFDNIPVDMLPRFQKIADAVNDYQVAEKSDTVRQLLDSYTVTTPDALKSNTVFKSLPEKQQAALMRRMVNNSAGTPEADASSKKMMVDIAAYPKTDNISGEYLGLLTYALEHVPDPQFTSVISALEKKKDELAQNGGQLKPADQVKQYGAKKIGLLALDGTFGKVPDEKTKGTPEYTQKMIVIEKRKAELLQILEASGVKNESDVDSVLGKVLSKEEAKKASESIGGKVKNFFFGTPTPAPPSGKKTSMNDEFRPAIATSFGTNVDGSRDPEDNQRGKYAGAKTGDRDYMGASLSKAALAEHGIPVDKAGDYDVIVRKGDKEVRVPIADLGPSEKVEARNGRTVDLTGAVHRHLGMTGKDKISYRVVPRAFSEA